MMAAFLGPVVLAIIVVIVLLIGGAFGLGWWLHG